MHLDYKNEEVTKMRKLIDEKKSGELNVAVDRDQTKTAPQSFTKSVIAWMKLKAKFLFWPKILKELVNFKYSPIIPTLQYGYPPWKTSFGLTGDYISVEV